MKISDKQIQAVIRLPGPKRYGYFIKMVADQRRVWGLFENGWALAGDSTESPVFPIWPAREYAALCASGAWVGYEPREISIDEVRSWLLPKLRESGTALGVFYTPDDTGDLPPVWWTSR